MSNWTKRKKQMIINNKVSLRGIQKKTQRYNSEKNKHMEKEHS